MRIEHPIEPVFDENSEIMILGSFPSVKSRETEFYYGNPQNRFWRVMAAVFNEEVPSSVAEKKHFLLKNHIALWDVISSCEISGSADSSIKNVEANDLNIIYNAASIKCVFTNGKTADKLYKQYYNNESVCLPSTSPANAQWSEKRLTEFWKNEISNYLR